jgi:catechol 2,3-dioxygenase-like lactoylglutathione lyase family enzyme
MSVELNHTIIPAGDKWASAKFLADIPDWKRDPSGATSSRSAPATGSPSIFPIRRISAPQHYAFLVSEAVFDAAFSRVRARGVAHYANFRRERPGEINHLYGGRGVYFDDPNGHLLELITRPYGPVPRGG